MVAESSEIRERTTVEMFPRPEIHASLVDRDRSRRNRTQRQTDHSAYCPAQLCAVIKADAYGHGDVPVAEAAMRGGAAMLAVALVEEGVRLREADVDDSIVVLSEPDLADTAAIVTHSLTPTAYRMEFVERLAHEAEAAENIPYPVHLKVDTGMHRVGAPIPTALEMARTIHADPRPRTDRYLHPLPGGR